MPKTNGDQLNTATSASTDVPANGIMRILSFCLEPLTTVQWQGQTYGIPLWLGALLPIWILTSLLPLWSAALVFFGACAGGMIYLVVSEVRRRRSEKQRVMVERMRAIMVSDPEAGSKTKQPPSQVPPLV